MIDAALDELSALHTQITTLQRHQTDLYARLDQIHAQLTVTDEHLRQAANRLNELHVALTTEPDSH